jgi:hypothetical protein
MQRKSDPVSIDRVAPRHFDSVLLKVRHRSIDPLKLAWDLKGEALIHDARFDVGKLFRDEHDDTLGFAHASCRQVAKMRRQV